MKLSPASPQTPADTDATRVPCWAAALTGGLPTPARPAVCSADGRWALASTQIPNAGILDDDQLETATVRAYSRLLAELAATPAPCPVRAWNMVPDIHRSQSPGTDRYMAFNAGRHAAYEKWFGSDSPLGRTMPTASAVGHDGKDLVIHLLGHERSGRAIENPRQVPAFRYSPRFGRIPPSFVRATVLDGDNRSTRVLVAGTASVVGEDSFHADDLQSQLTETFRNLAAVALAATKGAKPLNGHLSAHEQKALAWYESVRVYVRHEKDLPVVVRTVREHLPGVIDYEWVRADICRPELLVEIEGVAVLTPCGGKP